MNQKSFREPGWWARALHVIALSHPVKTGDKSGSSPRAGSGGAAGEKARGIPKEVYWSASHIAVQISTFLPESCANH